MEKIVGADGRPSAGQLYRLERWLSCVNALGGKAVACALPADSSAGTPDRLYFYRPGAILVRDRDAGKVDLVQLALKPRATVRGKEVVGEGGPQPITRLEIEILDGSTAPDLLADLREDLRNITSLDYVAFPATLSPTPWVNGGPGGWPATVPNPRDDAPTVVAAAWRSGPAIVIFDTGLLDVDRGGPVLRPGDPEVLRPWMSDVSGESELQQGGPDSGQLNLFDCHGMFVAGVLACAAPETPIDVVRVYDDNGSVSDFELATKMDGYLTEHSDVRLVNLSGGMYVSPNPVTPLAGQPITLGLVIEKHSNVLFVAAAGNDGGTRAVHRPFYPAAFGGSPANVESLPNVVGVGASDADGGVAPFSNHMPSAQVWAHGQDVVNAFKPGTVHLPDGSVVDVQNGPSGTAVWHGTSFAAPLVAGVLARYIEGLNGAATTFGAPREWLEKQGYGTTHKDGRLVVRATRRSRSLARGGAT
jgi:hypothetical protein